MRYTLILLFLFVRVLSMAEGEEAILFHLGHTRNLLNPYIDGNGRAWNRINTWGETVKGDLVDSLGNPTQGKWKTVRKMTFHFNRDPFESRLRSYPSVVGEHGYYFSASRNGNGELPGVLLLNLDPENLYTLVFYASAPPAMRDDASTLFEVEGRDGQVKKTTLLLKPGDQAETEATIRDVKPSENGTLSITMSLPEGYRRGYWNALQLIKQTE